MIRVTCYGLRDMSYGLRVTCYGLVVRVTYSVLMGCV